MADQTILTLKVQLETRDIYRYSMTTLFHRFRWFALIMVFVGLGLAVSLATQDWRWEWSWQSTFGPVFVFVVMPYAFFVAPYFSSRKYLRKNPNVAGPSTYTFSEEGIDVSGPNSQGHLNWAGVMEVRETSAQFLFYPQAAIAYIIPKKYLSNPEQQEALRSLVRTHVKKVKLRG